MTNWVWLAAGTWTQFLDAVQHFRPILVCRTKCGKKDFDLNKNMRYLNNLQTCLLSLPKNLKYVYVLVFDKVYFIIKSDKPLHVIFPQGKSLLNLSIAVSVERRISRLTVYVALKKSYVWPGYHRGNLDAVQYSKPIPSFRTCWVNNLGIFY